MSLAEWLREADDEAWLGRLRDASAPSRMGFLGNYELLSEAGVGAQGVVIRARQFATNRIVALKKLRAGSFASNSARRRFDREVEILACLDHENVVRVLGVEDAAGEPVLVMEWVDGVPVTERAREWQSSKDGVEKILRLFLQVCDGVHHAHLRGVIHRDLKPSNVLADAQGTARVLDFGVARREGGETVLTLVDEFIGTPAYASPEQLRLYSSTGDAPPLDLRTDVYSLGVLLFEMLTARRPFDDSKSIPDLLRSIEVDAPPRPSRHSSLVGEGLDRIVLKSLAKDREHRYQSVDAMAADVGRVLSNEPVQGHPPSRFYYLSNAVKRYPRTAALTAIAAACILAFGAISAVQSARLSRESATSNSLLSLVLGIVDSAGPGSLGPDAPVLEVLEAKSADIEKRFASRPDVLASIHNYLGHTYLSLGRLEDAERHLRLALAHRAEVVAASSPELATIRCLLAEVLHQRGDFTAARGLFESALEIQRRDPERSSIAHTLVAFGEMELEENAYGSARGRALEALPIREKRFGRASVAVAECKLLEAWAELGLGHPKEAARAAEEALASLPAGARTSHPRAAEAKAALGAAQLEEGLVEKSIASLEGARDIENVVLPRNHVHRARTLGFLARAYARAGRGPDAAAAAREALEVLRSVRGERDPRLAELEALAR